MECIGATAVGGFWFQFCISLLETSDHETFYGAHLHVTSSVNQGPLAAVWLEDRLDHPALGEPSAARYEDRLRRTSMSLGPTLLQHPRKRQLTVDGERTISKTYISATNPYYRENLSERRDVFNTLISGWVSGNMARQLTAIERLGFRVKGGPCKNVEVVYGQPELTFTRFGNNVTFASGTVEAYRKDRCQEIHEKKADEEPKDWEIYQEP